jgi:hypothetical protein
MALEHFVPEVWAGRILTALERALVFSNVATTEYQGEISGFGDVVKINEIGPVTVNTYSSTSTGALTVQQLTDAQKLLKINQSKYTAFWLDDEDNAQTKPKVMMDGMAKSGQALGQNIDEYIAALYPEAGLAIGGVVGTGVDVTSTNVMKYLSLAQQKLDEADTPQAGRWIVIPPWFAQKMALANVALNTDNSATMGAGFIGSTFYGFNVYVSNSVVSLDGTDQACIMAGYTGSIALAKQLQKVAQEDSGTVGFKTLVKALLIYGAKVIRPNNLGILYADYTAEAT